MKPLLAIALAFLLFGCGVETAGTAATAGKLQADQAKRSQESAEKMKKDLDAAMKSAQDNARKAEEAAK